MSTEVMAAVVEDNEELSIVELLGLSRLYGCKAEYLAAPTLQMVDPATNRGKRRLLELRGLMEQAAGLEVVSTHDIGWVRDTLERGDFVTYAAWRQACQSLNNALQLNHRKVRTARRAAV